MNSPSEESFLSVAEIAELLKVNRQTIRNWILNRYLPAVRVGRRVRIAQSDLQDFLRSHSTGPFGPGAQEKFQANGDRPPAIHGSGHRASMANVLGARAEAFRWLLNALVSVALALDHSSAGLSDALRALAAFAESWADDLDGEEKSGTHSRTGGAETSAGAT